MLEFEGEGAFHPHNQGAGLRPALRVAAGPARPFECSGVPMARVKPLSELIEGCIGPAFAAQGFASSDILAAAVMRVDALDHDRREMLEFEGEGAFHPHNQGAGAARWRWQWRASRRSACATLSTGSASPW
jgi:hypothetical protein